MLGTWATRPSVLRSLFNPAFTASILCVAVRAFDKDEHTNGMGMPFLMTHFILPLALHTETRRTFPNTTRTSIVHWVTSHQKILIGLSERTVGLRSLTCEGVRYAIAANILTLTQDGTLKHVPRKPIGLGKLGGSSKEVAECLHASEMLGHWFARVPDTSFLIQLLRIR